MRIDMPKVVTEPARRGVAYYRSLPNEYRAAKHFKLITNEEGDLDVDDEFCTNVQPMRSKRVGWDGKEKNYTSRPIKRFLLSRVGQNWDDVYSEICSVFRDGVRGNKSGYRGVDRLIDWHIERNTYLGDDGKVYYNDRFRPDNCADDEFGSLYVHPITKIICHNSERGESYRMACRRRAAAREAERAKTRVIINKKLQLHKLNGSWYRITVGEVPSEIYSLKYYPSDVLGAINTTTSWYYRGMTPWNINQLLIARYGEVAWGIKKEAASKTDIRRYKLS